MNRMPAFADPSQQSPSDQALIHPTSAPAFDGAPPIRVGVMASGNGSNFEALATAIRDRRINAEIALLVVNNPGCGAQHRAERLGIPWQLFNHRDYDSRTALDRDLVDRFRTAEVEGIVMAGWMRIVTGELIKAFPDRLINIHPSLLPSFRGLDGVGQALKAGVRLAGCTVHLVTEDLDAGPILVQAAVPVLETDDHDSLSKRIQLQEHRILPSGLMLAAQRWRQG